MTYNLIEHIFDEIYLRSCNARKTMFSCENDWHDDSVHGSLPKFLFLFVKGLSQFYPPKIIDFYFDSLSFASFNWEFLLLCGNLMTLFV